jgi:quinolinate synthase
MHNCADSLVMASKACAMAEAGCRAICVLGVDFMSENVRAILNDAGHPDVAVYRMASDAIGCSLAEAAESPAYDAYLAEAKAQPCSLHVVYINTSLRTKALANEVVPTITCTSSNVVQTVLQAFAQVCQHHMSLSCWQNRRVMQCHLSSWNVSDQQA